MNAIVAALVEADQALFQKINGGWTHPLLDQSMPVLTDLHRFKWLVFGILPLLLGFWIYKQRAAAVRTIVILGLSIGLSDAVAYRVVKPLVQRERPAYSGIPVTLRTNPHSGKSFPSNHAANNFAAAHTLGFAFPLFRGLFFLIAFVIAYSRVYVGVHFPLDVTAGAVIGLLVATAVRLVMKKWESKVRNGAGSSRAKS